MHAKTSDCANAVVQVPLPDNAAISASKVTVKLDTLQHMQAKQRAFVPLLIDTTISTFLNKVGPEAIQQVKQQVQVPSHIAINLSENMIRSDAVQPRQVEQQVQVFVAD